jgi:hypothetical protein
MKNYILPLIILCTVFTTRAHAVNTTLISSSATPNISQEFSVDLLLDPQGQSYNAIEGTVSFSDPLVLRRIEDGGSIVHYWINPPTIVGNEISFSGIMPGNFDGLIDPFTPAERAPGKILRLVFTAPSTGNPSIVTSNINVALSNGLGTLQPVAPTQLSVHISGTAHPTTLPLSDTNQPLLQSDIVKDKNLYDGKYTLVFNAIDKESGIARIEVAEGDESFHDATSPYLLRNQTRNLPVHIRVTDTSGNTTLTTIPAAHASTGSITLIIIICCIILIFIWYILEHKKRQI